MNQQLDGLIDYFAGDVLTSDQAQYVRSERDRGRQRKLLAAMLTMRPPRPIPAKVLHELDLLLSRERDERGVIEAMKVPTLADEEVGATGLPLDRIALWRGDLTRLRAGAIVNAANAQMLGCFQPEHACIDNVIHAAAGPELRAECARHMSEQGHPEPTGTATVTGGYHLPAKHVIHTVGPIVHGELRAAHEEALANSYRSILAAAEAAGLDSVGLCSVSTGVFGFPKAPAATICLTVLAAWFAENPSSRLRVIISLFTAADEAVYRAALQKLRAA
ncbi:macro domain-containing protein [Herbiconiux sp. SYSU D00978]|uniref:macro domain-containing protein n=1 Tax=Herbiconiux sp. SYSU D00978 TaxID=2812562 RepID=UPI001A97A95E|nr:macro domain-containing protein [Herbiconiux sp. SYSU D00978]